MDDVSYFHEVIDWIVREYKVDEQRIFVTGWSNGAIMAYRLACEMSERIAAVAPFVGSFSFKNISVKTCEGEEI